MTADLADWPCGVTVESKTTWDENRVVMVWARVVRRGGGTRNLVRGRLVARDGRTGKEDIHKEDVGNYSDKDDIKEGLEDNDLEDGPSDSTKFLRIAMKY